ncbi:GNAT family N-acetyltransferase [Flexivirga sp. B27]
MTAPHALRDKPTLTGERVVLRPFVEADLARMASAIRDPEVSRWTEYDLDTRTLPAADAPAEVDDRLRDWYLSRHAQTDRLDLAIVDRASGECVGEVVLNDFDPDASSCNFRTLIGPGGRSRGLGSEATRLIIEHAFTVGIEQVELEVFIGNDRARRAYEKAGFRVTGRRRAARQVDGAPEDALLMTARVDDDRAATPALESVVLPVRPGQEREFEEAFAGAIPIISRQKGFRDLRLTRCVERPNEYLLQVQWEQLTDHTVGFRESDDYQLWRAALHHFYDPVPTVDHFTDVLRG